ncbi:2-amino-4-hydroxy-6-hydroxymethyldihydropteridine diphosphokinase [Methylophilaceae bacterium]|jgi:2-amino-4-hydroxy-6-hydroxymethyldihydropteridine diphosphokinase|nr:2-amino-4-hydroxy-6-hydroxymethyldihydropteridine diphosphokinase [Methylophilaceae bacterium]
MNISLKKMHNIFIGLGSNLDNPQQKIKDAIDLIEGIDDINIIATSSLYETPPVGFLDQPNFINAVIQISSSINYNSLLIKLLDIELKFGRIRKKKNGPRTLDLDILLFDDLILKSESLIIPHPRMHERLFVLIPLLEISPAIKIPKYGSASELISRLTMQNIKKVEA